MGLYLPVIIDDPHESSYDAEWMVVMDDWTDGSANLRNNSTAS
jgi:FtsP/CotA-like multicopper oxidase with cupredoxin domain